MGAELERRDDAEVAAGAANSPEQVGDVSVALAVRTCPSAVTISTESRLSMLNPCVRRKWPYPPCSVSPPIAGRRYDAAWNRQSEDLRLPIDVAPCGTAGRAHGPVTGSTCTPRIPDRSITTPPSFMALPATLWPPPRIDSSRPRSRAKFTASTTSAVPEQRTMSAGRRSIRPF